MRTTRLIEAARERRSTQEHSQGIAAPVSSRPSQTGQAAAVDLTIAGGYPYPYRNSAAELAAANAGRLVSGHRRLPGDCQSFRRGQGGIDLDQLLNLIGKQPEGSIRELGLVGHANEEAFVLGGRISGSVIHSTREAIIHGVSIKENMAKIEAVRDRFATQDIKPPSITLFACDAGAADTLLDALSKAFHVTVRGFKHEIWWCFMGSTRGRTFYDSAGFGLHPKCDFPQFEAVSASGRRRTNSSPAT